MQCFVITFVISISLFSGCGEEADSSSKAADVSGYSGLVETNGTFNVSQTGTASHPATGSVRLNYYMKGQILGKEWQGNYKQEVMVLSSGTSCNFLSTFTGKKQ